MHMHRELFNSINYGIVVSYGAFVLLSDGIRTPGARQNGFLLTMTTDEY